MPARNPDQERGHWSRNRLEWRWIRYQRKPSLVTMWPRPKLVIPYLGPHGAVRSRTRIRHWFRDIWMEVGQGRLSKHTCIALADECYGRAARIYSYPRSVGNKLDNASEPWSREHAPTTAQCHCGALGNIDPAMIDPATKHVRCTNVSKLIESWCSKSENNRGPYKKSSREGISRHVEVHHLGRPTSGKTAM